ncbi:U3 small nucleolar RNA-associated protein, putative [Candida dubliniensis CD36]|uniref:U3 small nucleolar RNA-associated protein, putative n=1 Tax=Candida dubliniensis (strain CD36 / ATCC MYA-646 / CBS 7987 / NCPF 3949 / NRRL Y-17841) TaxID=573826 RepID=B9WD11_CANDC|nr:U3 small nucleolar RNA-associated protein, putative [Candida dubliniensis CD36]CAX42560.1 U3 small nucleolar RNA-associated protein, putative [Candida dubliniensis CD36]
MSKPELYDQYMITSLPRTPDLDLSEKVVVSTIKYIDTSIIDIGVSKSTISSYITKPTPKLLWSYSLNPTTMVDCMDVLVKDDKKYYVCGLSDRKKFRLLLLETTRSITEDGNANYATTNEFELKLDRKAAAISFMSPEIITVVYVNGSAEEVEFSESTLKFSGVKYTGTKNKDTVVYSEFVNDLEDNLLLTVSRNSKNTIYKLISINSKNSIFEVNSHSVSGVSDDAKFCYSSGSLYQYTNKAIESRSITNFKITNTICVDSIINDEEITSVAAPAPDRILIGNANMIYLINVRFASLLSSFKSSSSSSHPIPDKVFLNQVVPVKGNSTNSYISMAVYLNLKNKDNNVYLNVIDVNVGMNKLSECLGKSLNKSKSTFHEIPELFNIQDTLPSNGEIQEVYSYLKDAREAQDLNKWESILIPYLKNKKTWAQIKSLLSTKPLKTDKVYEFKEFEDDKDRVIDIGFIESVLELIFTEDPLAFANEEFVPEYTLMYLLTNPLFPIKFTSGLIELFSITGNTTLLRQAVNTCPNIPCRDLLDQLVIEQNKETLLDLINRLIGEFSRKEITNNFKQLIQLQGNAVDVVELISKLIGLPGNNNWYLIEILIDVNGLFNWDMEDIKALEEIISHKVEALTINSYNLTLSHQVMLHNKRLSKKAKEKGSSSQLDNLLTLTNHTTSAKFDDASEEANVKVPVYSVERVAF